MADDLKTIVDEKGKIYPFEKHYIELALGMLIEEENKKLEENKKKIAQVESGECDASGKSGIAIYNLIKGMVPISISFIHDLKTVLERVKSMEVHS